MNIDWNEAPEWAVAHALYAFGGEISEVWVGEDKYQRLDQSKAFPYGGGVGDSRHNPTRSHFRYETPRLAPWSGEGLPPVGTVCEFRVETDDWRSCEVIAHQGEYAVCWIHCNKILASSGHAIRPICTPEQISAEERQKAIEQMRADAGTVAGYPFERLYDAGYRKQVAE